MKRVVITGLGTVNSLGNNVAEFMTAIKDNKSAVQRMDGWEKYHGLQSLVGAPAVLKDVKAIPRKARRSMGRMSILAAQSAAEAIADSGLSMDIIASDQTGCIVGSTMGGAEALNDTFETMLPDHDLSQLTSMKFFQCVSHTAAMNVAQYLGIKGMVLATSAACASALQALGAGYDLIRMGRQTAVLCGGAEELHPTVTGSFDILFATSTKYNDKAQLTPRPFDSKRDGLACGEGAGIIILEEYEHAKARGAKIYAEITGYDTCGSGSHVSQSNSDAMVQCMKKTLAEAKINASDIDYISAHATATMQGDAQEADAIAKVIGSKTPVSSLKGNLGHTLGASGAIELIASLDMMQNNYLLPTRNLENIAEDCSMVEHVLEIKEKKIDTIMKNCFAFGGINAALICKKI